MIESAGPSDRPHEIAKEPRDVGDELRHCPEAKAIGAANDDGAFGYRFTDELISLAQLPGRPLAAEAGAQALAQAMSSLRLMTPFRSIMRSTLLGSIWNLPRIAVEPLRRCR